MIFWPRNRKIIRSRALLHPRPQRRRFHHAIRQKDTTTGPWGYTDFMQGNQKVMLSDLRAAADTATANPDGFLDRLVADRSRRLREWATTCDRIDLGQGSLATATQSPIPSTSVMTQHV